MRRPVFIPEIWTSSQRGVVLVFIIVMVIGLGVRYWYAPVLIPARPPDRPGRYDELSDGIDPNTAGVSELAAIPMLGEKRAGDIVAYRERFIREHPGKRAFVVIHDLTHVKGIGLAMLADLEPYLVISEGETTEP